MDPLKILKIVKIHPLVDDYQPGCTACSGHFLHLSHSLYNGQKLTNLRSMKELQNVSKSILPHSNVTNRMKQFENDFQMKTQSFRGFHLLT